LAFPLVLALAVHGDEPKTETPTLRPGLRQEHEEFLRKGVGKLTEAEVFAKLGHPDEICLADPPFVIPDVRKTWRDVNRMEVDFDGGKAMRIVGRFSPVSPAADINETVLRTIKPGMTVDQVEQAVGFAPTEKRNRDDKSVRYIWHRERRVSATFAKGKITGYEWTKGFRDKEK
jgi:hypothetical protein